MQKYEGQKNRIDDIGGHKMLWFHKIHDIRTCESRGSIWNFKASSRQLCGRTCL